MNIKLMLHLIQYINELYDYRTVWLSSYLAIELLAKELSYFVLFFVFCFFFACLWFIAHSRIFHSHMETLPLPVKGCRFWPMLGTLGHWAVRVRAHIFVGLPFCWQTDKSDMYRQQAQIRAMIISYTRREC